VASPEKTTAKVQAEESPVKSDKSEAIIPESEPVESGIDVLPEVEEEKEIVPVEPEEAEEEPDRVSEAVIEQVVEQPPEGATTGETEEVTKVEEPAVVPELDSSAAETNSKAAKKPTKHRKEIERKKRKREECRKKKIDATYQFVDESEEVVAETALSLSSSLSSSSDDAVSGQLEPREDITAKESVLGALGLQSTRLAQQERPKVPKLKLVVRPTPAKKKGHKSENGNEKTYAICHEVI
jgi:hypothetical protein